MGNTLENEHFSHRLKLLQIIGEDIRSRGKAGFNVEVQLMENMCGETGRAKPGFLAYQWLQERRLIEILDSETISDMDGVATFVDIGLTDEGRALYDRMEIAYQSYLDAFRKDFSD